MITQLAILTNCDCRSLKKNVLARKEVEDKSVVHMNKNNRPKKKIAFKKISADISNSHTKPCNAEETLSTKNKNAQYEKEEFILDQTNEIINLEYSVRELVNSSNDEFKAYIDQLAKANFELDKSNGELEIIRKSLKKTIEKERSEFSSILKQTNQVFLSINGKGLVCQPISDFAKTLFRKNIEGNRASDVLFPSLKRGMVEFNILSKSFGKLFGNTEDFFDETVKSFPTAIKRAIGDSSEEKRFRISYSKILNTAGRVEKILCLVEDVTSESEIKWAYQEKAIRYSFLNEIFDYSEKEKIEAATSLSHLTGLSLQLLDLFPTPVKMR